MSTAKSTTADRTELHVVQADPETLVAEAREESRTALRHLVELLGQPAEWGDELEQAAFARGVAWRLTEAA